jgi:hypothetical protein
VWRKSRRRTAAKTSGLWKGGSEDLVGEGDFGQNAEGGFGLRVEKQGRFWVGSMSEDLGVGGFGAKPLESWRWWTAKKRQKTSTNIAENNETLSHCLSHSAVF